MEQLAGLLPFVLIAVAFWFLLIRPQRRQQQQLQATQRGLQVGDEVMLGSGIFGVVHRLDDDRLELEVAPGVRMTVARGAIVRVIHDDPAAETPEVETDEGRERGDTQL